MLDAGGPGKVLPMHGCNGAVILDISSLAEKILIYENDYNSPVYYVYTFKNSLVHMLKSDNAVIVSCVERGSYFLCFTLKNKCMYDM